MREKQRIRPEPRALFEGVGHAGIWRKRRQTHSTQAGGEKFKSSLLRMFPFWAKQMWKALLKAQRVFHFVPNTVLRDAPAYQKKSPREVPFFLYYPLSPLTMPGSGLETRLLTHPVALLSNGFEASFWCYHGGLRSRKRLPSWLWRGLWAQSVGPCHQHMQAMTLTSRSSIDTAPASTRGTCPWQEAASAELKTIRADQRRWGRLAGGPDPNLHLLASHHCHESPPEAQRTCCLD